MKNQRFCSFSTRFIAPSLRSFSENSWIRRISFSVLLLSFSASQLTAQEAKLEDEKDTKPKKNRDKEGRSGNKKDRASSPGSEGGSAASEARKPGRPGFPGGDGFPGGPGLGMMMRFLPIMVALDTDQDGEISSAEIANASKSLQTLDKDGNGSLSPEELRPDPKQMMEDMPPAMRDRIKERMKGEGKEKGDAQEKGRKKGEGDGSGIAPKRPE